MTELETLYQEANDNEIEVFSAYFSPVKKAACICCGTFNVVLDHEKMESDAEEAEMLAHEMTHIKSGHLSFIVGTANTRIARVNRAYYEAATNRETVFELLPKEKLQKAIYSEGMDYWKIADYCGRTTDFVKKAFEVYDNMGIVFEVLE